MCLLVLCPNLRVHAIPYLDVLVPPQVTLFWCGVIRCNIIKFLQDVLTKWLKIIKNLKSLEFQLCYQWMNFDKQYWIFKSDNKSFFSSVNKFLCSKVPLTCRYSLQKVFFFSQHPSSCIRPPLTLNISCFWNLKYKKIGAFWKDLFKVFIFRGGTLL